MMSSVFCAVDLMLSTQSFSFIGILSLVQISLSSHFANRSTDLVLGCSCVIQLFGLSS